MTAAQTYEQLAERFEREQEPRQRDDFLVLAADAAHHDSRLDEAERLRRRLLEFNPHHMLRPFASFADALETPDVRDFVAALQRQYPLDYARSLLPGNADSGKMGVIPLAPATPPARKPPRETHSPPPNPYESLQVPLPANPTAEFWSTLAAQGVFYVVLTLLGIAAVYVLARPFLGE